MGVYLVSLIYASLLCGSRPEGIEQKQTPVYSVDPATVAPGAPSTHTASCPGQKLPDQVWQLGWRRAYGQPERLGATRRTRCRALSMSAHCLSGAGLVAGNARQCRRWHRRARVSQSRNRFAKCLYLGNRRFGRSGKATGGDAYESRLQRPVQGGRHANGRLVFAGVHGGDLFAGPTQVQVRLGAPDVVNGVVQEEILYANDPRIPGAALHIPRGSAPPNKSFTFAVLPQPAVGSAVANGDNPFSTTGFAVDVHATNVDQFVFANVPGASCPRLDLPYSPATLVPLLRGQVQKIGCVRARSPILPV